MENFSAQVGGAASGVQRYSAFGEVRSRGGEMPTVYQYTGQLSQMEQVGLYHYGARWFDPAGAHFTQADTLVPGVGNPLSWDRYAYVKNNPINYTDPTGHIEACEENCVEQRKLDKLSAVAIWKEQIRSKFEVTISDAISIWDPLNLSIVFFALKQIDLSLGGKTAAYNKGSIFYLAPKEAGSYSGWTSNKSITFYTSSNIPTQNVYHEYGHLLDNVFGDRITTALGTKAVYYDGEYLFGGKGVGYINSNTLKSMSLNDPNWINPVDALQHPSTDPSEQWADIFANLISGNIAHNGQGYTMWKWVFDNAH